MLKIHQKIYGSFCSQKAMDNLTCLRGYLLIQRKRGIDSIIALADNSTDRFLSATTKTPWRSLSHGVQGESWARRREGVKE